MSEERRADSQEMHDDIKEIKNLLQNENGLCVRMKASEVKTESIQSELTEHKNDTTQEKRIDRLDTRFWFLIGGFIMSVIGFFWEKIH